ncbi:hypothetical protein AVEN_208504-1 [Araneus ventricosus]|uniref:DUF4371 domain-containing protein n=1 Tax=Araneus ventricosus TaxID=182803 RepID=A0A4Y2E765_ARAVE|nr:hypothetical protein AVEN_208504-1 [Araneus ventricosus]
MDLDDCHSQCYDIVAVMAGYKTGVQKRITEKNNLVIFINCDNHSLNLVGVHSAKQDPVMVTFFGTIQALYVFFSRSISRWEKLVSTIPITVKFESETRWSSRAEALKPVSKYLDELLDLLHNMVEEADETFETRSDARNLCNRMLTYDFLTLLGFGENIITRIDRIQKRLQDPSMNFHSSDLDLKALKDYFNNDRECIVNEALKIGEILC